MNRIKSLAIFNAISFVIHVSLSYLTQLKLINPADVGEISDRYESLFTPAGVTFAIWGVIYLLLGIFCLYHIIIAYKHDIRHPANQDLSRIGSLFIVNNLATAGWLFAWTNNQITGSFVLIFIQLLTLIAIHVRINIVDRDRESGSIVCTQLPLSIYIGWIAIATIANTGIFLVSIGWNGWVLTPTNWTITLIVIAVALGLMMITVRRNVWFGLVVIWGLYGIILKRETVNAEEYSPIIMVSWGGAGLLAMAALIQAIRNFVYKRKNNTKFPEAKESMK